ncbi:hypothetical protein FKM82_024327, partial [Ascaphus truei]
NPAGECSWQVSVVLRESAAGSGGAHTEKREQPSSAEREGCTDADVLRLGRVTKRLSEEPENSRGVFKRRVEVREHTEERLRQQEAEQLDFRRVLGKKVNTRSISEEDLPDIPAEQMDFRANLQRQVKPKALSEDERKVNSPQQVDFRSVLGKKATLPKTPVLEKGSPKPATPDFRSVLGGKKKAPTENGNSTDPQENASPAGKEENAEVNCCPVGEVGKSKVPNAGSSPTFSETLRDRRVVDGEKLVLQCHVTSEPPPAITWTLDDKVIKSPKYIVLSQEGSLCSLTIEKTFPEDEGRYQCIAENSFGQAGCTCNVFVEDTSGSKGIKKSKKPRSNPPSAATTENEATIKKKPAPKTPPKAASPPQILQFPDDMKVRAGESVVLVCKVAGTQPITCMWMKFRKQIKENEFIKVENTEDTSKLTISSARQEHCGCYTMVVESKHGSKQAQVNLTVFDKPDPPAGQPCASDVKGSYLTLSWYGPTYDGGSVVESYTVEIWDTVDKTWSDLTTCRSTSFNVESLLLDREYKFQVRATSVYGTSEPSQESDLVTFKEKEEERKEEVEVSDDEEKQLEKEYRDVSMNTTQKVTEFYDMEERLGTGKFGQVFKLVEKKNKKVWAGKFFKAYSAKDKESVRQEISIMNCLHHPKLVQCVDAFEFKSDVVMVLELTPNLKVLFGTPEFVAPEVINYEPIGYATDMWSIGVICYILVSGLSPFMGDNDNETLANVTSATWDFDDEAFDEISDDAKNFISSLLKKDMKSRLNCPQCLQHSWLQKDTKTMEAKKLSKDRMKKYMARRKWQKTGHAVRAIGRLSSMAMISGLSARKSSTSSPTSPLATEPEANE